MKTVVLPRDLFIPLTLFAKVELAFLGPLTRGAQILRPPMAQDRGVERRIVPERLRMRSHHSPVDIHRSQAPPADSAELCSAARLHAKSEIYCRAPRWEGPFPSREQATLSACAGRCRIRFPHGEGSGTQPVCRCD